MAYANQVPWHGIGARVDSSINADEMVKAAGLDWDVTLRPLVATMEDGTAVDVPDRFALIRDTDHKVLTITGKLWKPLQNRDAIGFMDDYVRAGGATLETAGSLRDGKIIWGLAKLNHSFEVRPGDKVDGYLLITSPHEAGRAIQLRTTTVRVVCANTMAMANSANAGTTNYTQSHIKEFDVAAAKAHVGEAHEQLLLAEQRAKVLAGLKLNMEDAIKKVIVPVMFPVIANDNSFDLNSITDPANQPKRLQQVVNSMVNAPGAEEGTGWGVINGVTHWADHILGQTNETRMMRAWMGDTARVKLQVEKQLLALAA
jgi:phage/plasmid-like protein (TIGR03299 family)